VELIETPIANMCQPGSGSRCQPGSGGLQQRHNAQGLQEPAAAEYAAIPAVAPGSPPSAEAALRQKSSGSPGRQRIGGNAADQENAYLRRNVEHLRRGKRHLEGQVTSLEARVLMLEQQNSQYRAFWDQSRYTASSSGDNGEMEIVNLHQQLSAVLMLKDALHSENCDLQQRLQSAQQAEERKEMKHTACVICMDNLANVVCLPCKHLAICSFCSQQTCVTTCPICRSNIGEKMQIFMP